MDYRRDPGDRSRRDNDDYYNSRRGGGRTGSRSRGDSRRRRDDDFSDDDDYYNSRPSRPRTGTGSRKRPPQGDDSFERANSPLPEYNDRYDRGRDRDRDRDDRGDDWQNSGYGRDRDRDSANDSDGRGSRSRYDQSQRGFSRSRKGKRDPQERFEEEFPLRKGRPMRDGSKKTNIFREVCSALQKAGGNMKATHKILHNRKDSRYGTMPAKYFQRELGDILGELATSEMKQLIRSSCRDFAESDGFLQFEPLFTRFMLEMEKLELQERLFIQLRKKMAKHKCSFQAVLQKYEAIDSRDEETMNGFSFCKLLEKFGILSCYERDKDTLNLQELRPVFDEYAMSDDEDEDHKNDSNQNQQNSKGNQPINSSESARGGVATPADEVNRRNEELKYMRAKFRVSEVEQDFKEFEKVILPEVETAVMVEIAKYCTIQDLNLVKAFFPAVEGNGRRSGRDSRRSRASNNPMGIAVQPFIHVQDIYRISNNVQKEANYDNRNREYRSLFSVFIAKLASPKKLISFDYMYRLARRPEVQDIQNLCDKQTDKVLLDHYRTKLVRTVSEAIHLDSQRRSPEDLLGLKGGRTTNKDMVDLLKEVPFEIKNHLEDICILAALGKFFTANGQERLSERDIKEDFLIDSTKFLEEVKEGMAEYHAKDEVALKMSQSLFEKGLTIESLVSNVLGIKNAADFDLTEDDVSTCLSLVKCKVPPEQVTSFIRVLSKSFDQQTVAVEHLISEVKGFDRPKQQLDTSQQQSKAAKHLSKKIRKYRSVTEVVEHIGTIIEDFNLHDIGPLLKGQDYDDDGFILRGNFYQTLLSFSEFEERKGIMQGDILDLMNELDPKGTGKIQLEKFKYEVDPYIGPQHLKINLTSRVKDVVNETIVDKQKQAQLGEAAPREVQKPGDFFDLSLDIFCGLELLNSTVQEHFSTYSQSGAGINQREFWGGVEALKVTVEKSKRAAVFKYILDSQMNKLIAGGGSTGRSHGDTSRREEEVSLLIGTLAKNELLEVDILKEVLEDDIPFYHDSEKVAQTILNSMLPALSSKKVPILDIVDQFRMTDNQELPDDFDVNNVSSEDFQYKLLGPLLQLSVTPNQASLLSRAYADPEYPDYIQINKFIGDLQEMADKPSLAVGSKKNVQLFLTQSEVDKELREKEKLKLNLGDAEYAGRSSKQLESDPAGRDRKSRTHDPETVAKYLSLFCQHLRARLETIARDGIRFKDIRYSEIAELMRSSLRVSLDNDSSVQMFMNKYELWREKNLVGRAFTEFCRDLLIVQNFDQATLLALFHQKAPSERVKLQKKAPGQGRYSSLQSETLSSLPQESSLVNDRFGNKTSSYSHGRKVDISKLGKNLQTSVVMSELQALDGDLFMQKFRQGEVSEEEQVKVINWVLFRDFAEVEDPNAKTVSTTKHNPLQPKFVISAGGKVDTDNENPFRFVIPAKFLDFYRSLEKQINLHNQMYDFCDLLVHTDRLKQGFLSNPVIHKCFKRVDVELTKKEVAMVTYILHRGDDDTFSYPEMIFHMFGKQSWFNVKVKYGLTGPGFDIDFGGKSKDNEVKRIIISKKLQRQIEFYYSELLAVQDDISQGTDLLSSDEFQLLFTRVGIGLSASDKEALENFHSTHSEVGRNMMNVKELFSFYQMTDRLHLARTLIKEFFQKEEKQVKANILLRSKMYIFEDFVRFLRKAGFDLRLVSKAYKKQSSGDYSSDLKKDVHPDLYESEYPDLLDLYTVAKENQTMLSRRAIMQMFSLPELDVSRQIEEQRLGKESGLQRSSSRRSDRIFDSKQLSSTVAHFVKFVKADKARLSALAKIPEHRLPVDKFKKVLTDMGYPAKNPDVFDPLVQAFQPSPKDEDPKKRAETNKQTIVHDDEPKTKVVSIIRIKQKLGIAASGQSVASSRQASEHSRPAKDRPKDAISADPREALAMVRSHLKKYREHAKLEDLEKQTTYERLKALVAELNLRGISNMTVADFCKVLFSNPDKKIMANIDRDTQARLDQQIHRLFRQVDSNHNDFVDLDELYQLLKPLRPGKITKAECEKIIKEYDLNNDGQLDRDEFYQVVKHELAHYLTRKADDLQNYKIMFRLADRDMDGYLTKHEFIGVIEAHVVEEYDQHDLQKLIQFLDTEKTGRVHIDEFFVLLQNSGYLNFQIPGQLENSEKNENNRAVQRSLLEMRQGVGLDLFDFFAFCKENALPSFFEPSFLQALLEKEQKCHSDTNLLKSRDFILDPVPADLFTNAEQLAKFQMPPSDHFFEVQITDIDNVPVPKLGDSSGSFKIEDVQQRELRVILFDPKAGEYVSNAYILPATSSKDGKKWSFDFSLCVDIARTVCFKFESGSAPKDLEMQFELVITLKQKTKQGDPYQLTNGWGTIPVAKLLKHSDSRIHRIIFKGGSPNNQEEIDTSQVQEKAEAQKKRFGFFKKETELEDDRKMGKAFFLKVKVIQVVESDLTTTEHMLYQSLPGQHLFNKHLMTFISALNFHKLRLAANANRIPEINEDEGDEQNQERPQERAPEVLVLPQNDFLITCAERALNCTDLNLLMAAAWHYHFCPLRVGDGFKDMGTTKQVGELEKWMKLLVGEVYEKVMNHNAVFKVDRVYPTRPSQMNVAFQSQIAEFNKQVLGGLADKRVEGLLGIEIGDHRAEKAQKEITQSKQDFDAMKRSLPVEEQEKLQSPQKSAPGAFNLVEMMTGGSSQEGGGGMAEIDSLIRKHGSSIKRISNPGFDTARLHVK